MPCYNVNMVDSNNRRQADRDAHLNEALELMHFGFRAIIAHPDERLARLGYSRVHHRVLYFVGRHPGCTIKALLGIMRVSKQYLHRPLRQLVDAGYIEARTDPNDRRVKRLRLTARGRRLESTLTGEQREQMAEVFRRAGPRAEAGWRKVMGLLSQWPEFSAPLSPD